MIISTHNYIFQTEWGVLIGDALNRFEQDRPFQHYDTQNYSVANEQLENFIQQIDSIEHVEAITDDELRKAKEKLRNDYEDCPVSESQYADSAGSKE